jgi:hypothetical protein
MALSTMAFLSSRRAARTLTLAEKQFVSRPQRRRLQASLAAGAKAGKK